MNKEKNLELKEVIAPDWINDWALEHGGEAMAMYLIFSPETSVSKYFNKKYPQKTEEYSIINNNFNHYDFKDEGWDTYIEMKNEDEIFM